MKILYFGGQKCGKTSAAMAKTLELSPHKKPIYVATYLDTYNDTEMKERIKHHRNERLEQFITQEEGFDLSILKEDETYLVDCLSMWILNNFAKNKDELIRQLQMLFKKRANMVFVLNDVSCGVIPLDVLSRRFVDLSGILGQELVKLCDEVYEVKYGLEIKLK